MKVFGGNQKKSKEEEVKEPAPKPPNMLDDASETKFFDASDIQNDAQHQQHLEGQVEQLLTELEKAKEQIHQEKAGKRKIFHSLVKLANELKKSKQNAAPEQPQPWYEGGLWRNQVQVLPGVGNPANRQSEAVSLSDLFLDLVVVTAFTRVGQAISNAQEIRLESVLYFAVFWQIWSKEVSYTSRFDSRDISAKLETLLTCFAVLFGSLSASSPFQSEGATRIMMVAAFCAILNCLLHIRIAVVFGPDPVFVEGNGDSPDAAAAMRRPTLGLTAANETRQHVRSYAIFNVAMTLLEAGVWIVGILLVPVNHPLRWLIFLIGVLLALRVPRAFLANDFHAACSKRGVLFILLLGFLMQSIVVVATEFFQYDLPTGEEYAFLGASCLVLFCIKLLYVEDSESTPARDHALLVNRTAAFLFNVGHWGLLFSTTVMGSGLNLVTHEYLAATAALPGPSKQMVVGGFSAVVLSNYFIKSMHVKRVPSDDSRHRGMFIAAYVTETVVTLGIVVWTAFWTCGFGGMLEQQIMAEGGTELLFALSGMAIFLVLISWLDQGVELSLYDSAADSQEFRIQPFGIWSCCLQQEVTDEAMLEELVKEDMSLTKRFSLVSPLLGSSSAAFLRNELKSTEGYGSITGLANIDENV